MKTVYLYRGLPGSGKSTAARARMDANPGQFKRVNKDDLRAMLDNNRWSNSNEKFVLRIRDQIVLESLNSGKHVLIDDTNLHPKHLQRIQELVKGVATVEIVDFMHIDVETCIERDLKRPNSVGSRVIRRMWRQYLEWNPQTNIPTIEQDSDLPLALICDLDGTLAIIEHRSPYDASNCEQDELNQPVADIVQKFHDDGHQILFLSGREDKFVEPTVRFIENHLGKEFKYELIMRKAGDTRKDSLIKRELLETKVLPRFRVDFVLDDRNQVVDMWRSLGLTCLQVNYGDF